MTTSVLGGSLRRAGPSAWVGEWLSAWRGVTKDQLAVAGLLGVIAVSPPMLQTMLGPSAVPWPALARDLINAEIWAYTLLLAIVIADRSVDRGASRLRSYGSAAVLAAIVGTVIGAAHSHFVWDALNHPDAPLGQRAAITDWVIYTHQLYLVIEATLIGGVASYIYADRREARQMAARVHAASLRRTAQSRAMLESELQAMQARVEPELLFRTLARVPDLYDADRTQGDAMLDELIAYLRAAMPRMRDTASTLDQELELVRAYVAIVESQVSVTVMPIPESLSGRRMPSLVLLPLAASLLARRAGDGGLLRLVPHRQPGYLCIDMILEARSFPPPASDTTLEAVRERLAALFGVAAKVDVSHVEGMARLTLQLPDECVPDLGSSVAPDSTGGTSS